MFYLNPCRIGQELLLLLAHFWLFWRRLGFLAGCVILVDEFFSLYSGVEAICDCSYCFSYLGLDILVINPRPTDHRLSGILSPS